MESFFDKLKASQPIENIEEEYQFDTVLSEKDIDKDLLALIPIRSSDGRESIFVPKGSMQTFENIDAICTIRFFNKNENAPIDGCVIVSPQDPDDSDNIFLEETVNTIVWQMTEEDEEVEDYRINSVSKVIKSNEQGILFDYSMKYGESIVRNLQYITLKNRCYVIATVSIPEYLSQELGPSAFASALSLIV